MDSFLILFFELNVEEFESVIFYLQWVLHRTFVPPRDIPSGVICSLSVPEFRVAGLGKVEFPLKVVKHWGSLSAFGPERYLFWDLCMVIFW